MPLQMKISSRLDTYLAYILNMWIYESYWKKGLMMVYEHTNIVTLYTWCKG